jgi:hypothetical protein
MDTQGRQTTKLKTKSLEINGGAKGSKVLVLSSLNFQILERIGGEIVNPTSTV